MQSSTNTKDRHTIMHRIIDKFMPDNCRTQLKAAATENQEAVNEAVCLLKTYGEKIKEKVNHAA